MFCFCRLEWKVIFRTIVCDVLRSCWLIERLCLHRCRLLVLLWLLVGLLLGYVAVEYSIFWSMALHMFNNLVLADLLSRLTASWPDTAYGILNVILFAGSAVASVVILVKNRERIRAYREGEWMDRRCLKCFFTSFGILVLTIVMCISMAVMFFV